MEGRWMEALWNLLHLPAFFLLACFLHALWPRSWREPVRIGITIGAALFLGLATEGAQSSLGRSGNWGDVAFDAVGIALAVTWLLFGRRRRRFARIGFPALVLGVAIACLWPAWGGDWAEARQNRHLPEIGTFSEWETRMLWQAQGNARVEAVPGGLRLRIGKGRYGGVSYRPGTQDWSSFSRVVVEIENPGEPFELGIRIDDPSSRERGEWFSSSAVVGSGRQKIEVGLPAGAGDAPPIDLARVSRLALFTGREEQGREFVVKSAFLR